MTPKWKVSKLVSLGWWIAHPAGSTKNVRFFFTFEDAITYVDKQTRAEL